MGLWWHSPWGPDNFLIARTSDGQIVNTILPNLLFKADAQGSAQQRSDAVASAPNNPPEEQVSASSAMPAPLAPPNPATPPTVPPTKDAPMESPAQVVPFDSPTKDVIEEAWDDCELLTTPGGPHKQDYGIGEADEDEEDLLPLSALVMATEKPKSEVDSSPGSPTVTDHATPDVPLRRRLTFKQAVDDRDIGLGRPPRKYRLMYYRPPRHAWGIRQQHPPQRQIGSAKLQQLDFHLSQNIAQDVIIMLEQNQIEEEHASQVLNECFEAARRE